MYSLSGREKKLVALAVGLSAFVFWYKIFFGLLLPQYHQRQHLEAETLGLQENLSRLSATIAGKESIIADTEEEIKAIKHQLTSPSGFLLYELGRLAAGRVALSGMETRALRHDGNFLVSHVSVELEGSYQAIVDLVRELAGVPGISFRELTFNRAEDESPGRVTARLTVQHFDVADRERFPEEPGFRYEPYQSFAQLEPGEDPDDTMEETSSEIVQEPAAPEQDGAYRWPLAPYTFPVR